MAEPVSVDVPEVIRGILRARVSDARYDAEAGDDISIGASGLGLDSVAIVELLLDCEEALGVPFPAALFDGTPLTVRRLIDHAASYRRP